MSSLNTGERTFLLAVALVTVIGAAVVKAAARWPAFFPGLEAREGRAAAVRGDSAAPGPDDVARILAETPFSGRPTLLEVQIGRVSRAMQEPAERGRGGQHHATPIDPNLASAEELETVPGIGPVLAARIVADREAHGRFRRVAELDRVPGIGAKTLARLAPYLAVRDQDAGAIPPPAAPRPGSREGAPGRIMR